MDDRALSTVAAPNKPLPTSADEMLGAFEAEAADTVATVDLRSGHHLIQTHSGHVPRRAHSAAVHESKDPQEQGVQICHGRSFYSVL